MQKKLRKWVSRLKVSQKIGLGYALALSIAVFGTIAGFRIGNQQQQRAIKLEEYAHNEVELLQRLQSRVLQTRTHQQQLIPLLKYSARCEDEYNHLLRHRAELQNIWVELRIFVAYSPNSQDYAPQNTISDFVKTYSSVSQQYLQNLESVFKRIRQENLAVPDNIEQAQLLLLEFTNSDLALEFDGISDDLVALINQSYQKLEMSETQHEKADRLAEKWVVSSIFLSIVMAILVALLTNRAISKPI